MRILELLSREGALRGEVMVTPLPGMTNRRSFVDRWTQQLHEDSQNKKLSCTACFCRARVQVL